MVLTAVATNQLMAEQQARLDAKTLTAMMDTQPELLSPPEVR
jgi:hypothetical protein